MPDARYGGCSIYDHRPRTCRTFDCRVFAAAGVAVDADKPLSPTAFGAGGSTIRLLPIADCTTPPVRRTTMATENRVVRQRLPFAPSSSSSATRSGDENLRSVRPC